MIDNRVFHFIWKRKDFSRISSYILIGETSVVPREQEFAYYCAENIAVHNKTIRVLSLSNGIHHCPSIKYPRLPAISHFYW